MTSTGRAHWGTLVAREIMGGLTSLHSIQALSVGVDLGKKRWTIIHWDPFSERTDCPCCFG